MTRPSPIRAGEPAHDVLRRGGRGRVVSVHAGAVNLLFDDGPLLGLLPPDRPLHPFAATAPVDLGALVVGDLFVIADGWMACGGMRVPLALVTLVDLRLHGRPTSLPGAATALLRAILAERERTRPTSPFDGACDAVLAAFEAGDAAALAELVGVGEGLTPSGDDIVVGALAALDFALDGRVSARFHRRALAEALPDDLEARTSRLSAQLLRAAVDGLYGEPIVVLFDALPLGRDELLRFAADGLLAVGHRSGADTLRGIVAALAVVG